MVRKFPEKICTENHNLESEITFCRSNNNVNCLAATKYLATQIRLIFPEQKPSQQNKCDCIKKNVSHVKKDKFDNTKSCNGVDISDKTGFFSSEKWNKSRKNTGVLKTI